FRSLMSVFPTPHRGSRPGGVSPRWTRMRRSQNRLRPASSRAETGPKSSRGGFPIAEPASDKTGSLNLGRAIDHHNSVEALFHAGLEDQRCIYYQNTSGM